MKKRTKILTALLVCLLLGAFLLPLSGCRQQPVSESRFLLNTVCTLTVYQTEKGVGAEKAVADGFDFCEALEKNLSRTEPDGDIGRLNAAGGEPVTVSADTAEVIRQGLYYAELSGGRFDITIGAASALWDFTADTPVLPDEAALAAAMKTVGYENVMMDGDTVTLKNGAQLDLGGIAKGYITERLAGFLRETGVVTALINFGGNIVTVGDKADGTAWRIAVQKPFADQGETSCTLSVGECAVVSAGTYERGFELNGVWYHHLLDAHTGWPMQNSVVAVTVVTADATAADALSSTFFLLGSEEGKKLAESMDGVEAVWLLSDGSHMETDGIGTDIPADWMEKNSMTAGAAPMKSASLN